MAETTNAKDAHYLQSLVKEASALMEELSAMDKKMEADILAEKGALAVWWEQNIESNKVASFMADRAKDQIPSPSEEALKLIFQRVFKTLKYSRAVIGVVLAPFETSRQPSYKMGYLDSQFGVQYFSKKARLEAIYGELFHQMPPSSSSVLQSDRCAIEACWRKN